MQRARRRPGHGTRARLRRGGTPLTTVALLHARALHHLHARADGHADSAPRRLGSPRVPQLRPRVDVHVPRLRRHQLDPRASRHGHRHHRLRGGARHASRATSATRSSPRGGRLSLGPGPARAGLRLARSTHDPLHGRPCGIQVSARLAGLGRPSRPPPGYFTSFYAPPAKPALARLASGHISSNMP